MSETPRDEFLEALDSYLPLSEQEVREAVRRIRVITNATPGISLCHTERAVAIEFLGPGKPRSTHRAVHVSNGEHAEGSAETIIQVTGWRVTGVGRVLWGDTGGIALDHDDPEGTFGTLRRGDVAVLNEYFENPERFERYNPEDGLPWQPAD